MRKRAAVLLLFAGLVFVVAVEVLAARPSRAQQGLFARDVPLSVSCASPAFCVAVGDQGRAVRFDGSAWSRPRGLTAQPLTKVACRQPAFCVVGDVNGSIYVLRGGTWHKYAKVGGTSDGITSLSCSAVDRCAAGTMDGYVLHYDGTSWSVPAPILPATAYPADARAGPATVAGVSCPSAAFCAAVTTSSRALTWNGSVWSAPTVLRGPDTPSFSDLVRVPDVVDVSCGSPTFCVAVLLAGYAQSFDGTAWDVPRRIDAAGVPGGTRQGLTSVSCPSVAFCMAVDAHGQGVRYDGSGWSAPVQVDAALGLTSVSCTSSHFCVALDQLGRATVYDGRTWSAPRPIDS